jgi:hypothetical protein
MYYSYIEIEYVATSFSPARTDLALKLLMDSINGPLMLIYVGSCYVDTSEDSTGT